MAEKRYYWLKLHKDFFKRPHIKIIEASPNGKDYTLFYLKLLVESVPYEGLLRLSDTIPYNEYMLATITNTNIDVVKAALKMFIELNMIEILDDQTVYMLEVKDMIGSETAAAERKRRSRAKQSSKLLERDTVTALSQNGHTDNKSKNIELQSIEQKIDNTTTSVETKFAKVREELDWSRYSKEEIINTYPLNPEYKLTTAEVDKLYEIINESALERYLLKIQEYNSHDNFSTIIRWAKQDMNYLGEKN